MAKWQIHKVYKENGKTTATRGKPPFHPATEKTKSELMVEVRQAGFTPPYASA